jgi:signal transduction histidine kinase
MKQMHSLTRAVKRKLAIRFGLAFILVIFFGLSSIRFYTDRTITYHEILLMKDTASSERFSQDQLRYIAEHISDIEYRMLRELIVSNIVVILVFTFFSFLLSQGLFESLTESVEREKRFLDDASHELRTPTTAISTIAETTLRSHNNTSTDYKAALENILEESKRLASIIKDLLFISRNEDQGIKLIMEKQELAELVTTVSKKMQIVANLKSIQIETVLPTKKVFVTVDRDKIIQLLVALVDNAIKYSKENTKIILKLDDKPKVKVSVKDFGEGISSQDLPHIFERFYRSDTSRSESGTGLGLSIAQRIAEAHNAKLEVRSQIRKGSTFSLIF